MTNPQTLPILSLITLSHASPTALSALYAVCKDIGFFYLTDHGIPASTLIRLLELSRLFFLHAPAAEKAGLARRNPDRARGYQQIGENITLGRRDAHEAVDLYAPPPRPRGPSVVGEGRASIGEDEEGILSGENLWPSTPVELRAEVEAYVELVKRVGAEVVQAMALALGLKEDLGDGQWDSLVGQVRESFWVMRLIGYPSLEEESEGISCGEHTGLYFLLPYSLRYGRS
jgi:isopenicillin N synthase-like dioxygenase